MVNHVTATRNIYGLDIRKEKFKMEFLVSKRQVFDSIPKNAEIYHLIDEIRMEIKERKAVEDGPPMFHIEPLGNNRFELLAGVPVRDAFEAQAPFTTLKLLKGGNTLVTEIKGGQATADNAARILKMYADDHKDINVALPFNTLVTDRLAIKDSNQWVTRLNYHCL